MKDSVTILIYTFPPKGEEESFFARVKASLVRTWSCVGTLPTVIVTSHLFPALTAFAHQQAHVQIQEESSLVPGEIRSMSLDCIKRLGMRFTTPYVLIVQDDGFPIHTNLEDFVGKWDFIGAPIISDGWKRRLAYAVHLGSFNGGFSLRSRRLCLFAARMWKLFFSHFLREDSRFLGEDFYYTTWLRLIPYTWFHFRFPSEQDAFRFSVDTLGGRITPPAHLESFGVHGACARDLLKD